MCLFDILVKQDSNGTGWSKSLLLQALTKVEDNPTAAKWAKAL
jgi:hypothetical protein